MRFSALQGAVDGVSSGRCNLHKLHKSHKLHAKLDKNSTKTFTFVENLLPMATIYLSTSTKEDGRGRVQVLVRLSGGHGVTPRAKSGIFIYPTQWDSKKQRLNVARIGGAERAEALEAQRQLDELVAHIHEAFDNLQDRTTATSEWLAEVVAEYHNPKGKQKQTADDELNEAFERFMTEKGYSRYRAFSFRRVIRSLHRYGVIRYREITFDTLNERMLADFERFLADEYRYASDPTFAELYMNERGCKEGRGQNTVNEMLTQLRTFVLWAVEMEYTRNNPFKKYKVKECKYGTPFYLTVEERRHLFRAPMPTKYLARIRDIFVFQCCIGCRVSDLVTFTKRNIANGALEYVQQKTRKHNPKTVRVLLNQTALEIIERYKADEDAPLLPFVSDAYYNRAIKQCLKAAGITRTIIDWDSRLQRGVASPINEKATSQMARRTFIGCLHEQVKDPAIILDMSGHAENSRAVNRYRDIVDKVKAEAVALLD